MNVKALDANVFELAINKIYDLKDGYCVGLKALKKNSTKISISDDVDILGSCDIDTCTKNSYPNEARWDYVIGCNQKALFVEVHPADTCNIHEMIKKVKWLENWLKTKGKELAIIRMNDIHYWIPSGRVNILKTSSQYRALSKHKLKITPTPFFIKNNN